MLQLFPCCAALFPAFKQRSAALPHHDVVDGREIHSLSRALSTEHGRAGLRRRLCWVRRVRWAGARQVAHLGAALSHSLHKSRAKAERASWSSELKQWELRRAGTHHRWIERHLFIAGSLVQIQELSPAWARLKGGPSVASELPGPKPEISS